MFGRREPKHTPSSQGHHPTLCKYVKPDLNCYSLNILSVWENRVLHEWYWLWNQKITNRVKFDGVILSHPPWLCVEHVVFTQGLYIFHGCQPKMFQSSGRCHLLLLWSWAHCRVLYSLNREGAVGMGEGDENWGCIHLWLPVCLIKLLMFTLYWFCDYLSFFVPIIYAMTRLINLLCYCVTIDAS